MDVIDGCPILKPSAAEFSDFMGYIYSLEKTYSPKYGIVKVVLRISILSHIPQYYNNHNINRLSLRKGSTPTNLQRPSRSPSWRS